MKTRLVIAVMTATSYLTPIASVSAQTPAAARPSAQMDRAAINAASAAERDRELKLLGITAMRPGVTAYDIGKPGNANFDEALANPYPKLPALLTMNDGQRVKTPAQWKNVPPRSGPCLMRMYTASTRRKSPGLPGRSTASRPRR